jgi:hypothetical protein
VDGREALIRFERSAAHRAGVVQHHRERARQHSTRRPRQRGNARCVLAPDRKLP